MDPDLSKMRTCCCLDYLKIGPAPDHLVVEWLAGDGTSQKPTKMVGPI